MSDIDLTEAIRAAGDHLHADVCPHGGDGCWRGDYDREAEIAITAALPHIEAQLRVQIAADIESCIGATPNIADPLPWDWEQAGRNKAYRTAAAIARGTDDKETTDA